MSEAALLSIAGLRLCLDGDTALLDNLTLQIETGEVVALSGESGSGKTSLLRCLADLESRAIGELRFRGQILERDELPGFRREVLYVAQQPPLFAMTVEESLRAAFRFRSAGKEYDEGQARQIGSALRLPSGIYSKRLQDLSGGESQRVSLLRALMLAPSVLLLDEPTASLDPVNRDAVLTAIAQWHAAGDRAAVITTHNPQWWDGVLTRRIFLPKGGHLREEEL